MKRDWDLVREVLIETETLKVSTGEIIRYGPAAHSSAPEKDAHAILLWEAGFIQGIDTTDLSGHSIIAQGLTWHGHDLLETIRSKVMWEQIKRMSKDKGIELTFDAIKAFGKIALASLIAR